MRPKPFFIVNPVSGGGRTRGKLPRLRAAIEGHGFEPDLVLTERPWHAYELARAAIEQGHDTLVACGGDGTVFEVANAIFDLEAAARVRLGTIPLGTGKDVAKCLGMPRPAAALRAIAAGAERAIDVGRVESVDAYGQPIVRHFLLEASAGWIPEISHSIPRILKRLGDTSPYVVTAFVKMLGPMNRYFTLEIDGLEYHAPYNSISAHNMAFWGGDLEVAPGADPADGLLDAIRWGPLGRLMVLRAIQGQRQGGRHLAIEGVDHHAAKRVRLDSPKRTHLELDGEAAGFLPAALEVIPHALRFLAPSQRNGRRRAPRVDGREVTASRYLNTGSRFSTNARAASRKSSDETSFQCRSVSSSRYSLNSMRSAAT